MPVGLHRRCVQETSFTTSHQRKQTADQWNLLGSVSIEKEVHI